jgi:FkbM family methyltransferase
MLRARIGNVERRLRNEYRGNRPRAISRELFFRGARRFTPALIAEADGVRFHVKTYDRALGLLTFANGPPEGPTIALALAVLSANGETAPAIEKTFLEIGANIGTATVTALKGCGFRDSVSFEPLPENYTLLLANLEANGLADRSRALQLALSDHDGEAEFEVSPNNSGDGRVRTGAEAAGQDAFGESSRQVVSVEMAQLDSLCESGVIEVDEIGLAWIDAQGFEGQILSGARRLLESDVPVVTEFWPYGLERSGGRKALTEMISSNYETVVDLGADDPLSPAARRRGDQVDALFAEYERGSFLDPGGVNASTDLLLLKSS